MNRTYSAIIAVAAFSGLAACSQETQEDAARTAELAGDDIEANAAVVGEVIEEGAKDAAGAVSEGAANLEQHIEEGDKESPGPAPILGDELNSDQANPND
ncbi:hypothetical protein K3165_06650 [Qipengyuania sp. 1XM1-15A]|uniref:hypothetical protein n=1 Tax=Qipengyuania xiamenensis TaxID=2867237 RepID=UPI001C873A82|nr:hypothetical protein [Qipengyuania xiamenensis]MBX7532595.1 hypothetical protein [Qipengyuania xiamenensis]